MTLHIYYSHECPKCGAPYIPYDKDIPCPRCGLVEKERYDYVWQAADSLAFNLSTFGSYTPLVWAVLSLGDHILSILFGIFDRHRDNSGQNFEALATRILSQAKWGRQKYLEKHVLGIAIRVNEELMRRGNRLRALRQRGKTICGENQFA
nr:hypothetical protein [Candidatus Njordarchaeota archaeon]